MLLQEVIFSIDINNMFYDNWFEAESVLFLQSRSPQANLSISN